MTDIWVVGATGRSGQAIATELAARGADAVWVGRDAQRLAQVAGGGRTHVAATVAQLAGDIALRRPGVVVNTVGPFAATATQTARACLDAGSHYVDLANELEPVCAVLDLDADAIGARRTLVTGSGFGVLATEALVVGLVEGRPGAARVRVDAMPVVDALGSAVLASVIDSLAAGGRRYAGGALVRARLGSDFEQLTLPDGRVVGTVGVPTGELEAARRASGAADIVAASSEVPAARLARAALPILAAAIGLRPVRSRLQRLVARLRLAPPATSGDASWARARVEWSDGTAREAWLKAGEGYAFTARVAATVAERLAAGDGRPGAFTPAALFGADLAVEAGAHLIDLSTTGAPA